jgi:peptide-methionine (R)-S-oxide reductase
VFLRGRILAPMGSDDMRGKPDEYWREHLTPEEYEVIRNKGTEAPFTGAYVNHKEDGMYTCKACGAPLFSSKDKFDSRTGWPSFTNPAVAAHVETKEDISHGMHRTEILCRNCGGHLGHVFDDGPQEAGGKRYCVNSCSLDFSPEGKSGEQ